MPPPRPVAGQASAEYVALLAVVCAVVAGAAAVGSVPPIAAQVVASVKHGICLVSGGICTPREARAAGLSPCLVHARTDRERLGGRLLIVKLRRGEALLVERRSDGSASVSFADGGAAGANVGVGLRLLGRGANARIGAAVQFTAGRTWEFATAAEAARFVRRWGKTETLTGEVRGLLPGGDEPPPPDGSYKEGGAYGELAAALGGRVSVEADSEIGAVLGRRIERGGRVTWYTRIDAEAAAKLGLVSGAFEGHDGYALGLETTFVRGKPVQLRVRAAGYAHFDTAPAGPAATVTDLAALLRGSGPTPSGSGERLEAEVALDLTDPANRRAVVGALRSLVIGGPGQKVARLRELGRRLDADGAVDMRIFRLALDDRDIGADAGLGLGFGGAYERRREVRDLLRAWSLRAGGTLQEREDCNPA